MKCEDICVIENDRSTLSSGDVISVVPVYLAALRVVTGLTFGKKVTGSVGYSNCEENTSENLTKLLLWINKDQKLRPYLRYLSMKDNENSAIPKESLFLTFQVQK
ncbi:hypothetical protein LOAG_06156 [Loa loa]|uniref:Uncharacterized protein n=1 Tax=Loa loa TaxID=7209 RepID=A0A1S0TYN3_LOALO|nr:hypothetical protein LOAG_06156 [Loa loa]EFO22326.1 hypothetical protein LOAG_06156 [Loa loa]